MTVPAQQIEDHVLATLRGGGVEDLSSANVEARDRVVVKDSDMNGNANKMAIIVVGNETPMTGLKARTNTSVNMQYPVLVVLLQRVATTKIAADPWTKIARHAIWNLLWRNLLLGPDGPVRFAEYISDPKFDITGTIKDLKYSGQLFVYTTEELKPPTWSSV